MATWIIKAALQHVIGRLPASYWVNGLFQKYVTNGYYPSQEIFEGKLKCCRQHLDHYLKFSETSRGGLTAFELGTGPWPIVPIGLYLCGASEIITYDLVPTLRRDTLRRTLELFSKSANGGLLDRILGAVQPVRLRGLGNVLRRVEEETPTQSLSQLNIQVRIGDARASALPDNSMDLIFSTVVLEHIDAKILRGLLAEFRRIAKPYAVMSHCVGLADQYASFDKSITPFNFLKYSDRQWRVFNNPVIPQSRLRLADYRDIFRFSGWKIVEEHNTFGLMDDLNKIRLAPEFAKYSTEDLLVLVSWLIARLQ